MVNLWLKVENIVAKGEIACFEQFLLLSLSFQKAVCSTKPNDVGTQKIGLPETHLSTHNIGLNPFPHIDAFWRLCSRRLFENIVTK